MSDPTTKTISGIFSALVIGGAIFYFSHDAEQRKAERLAREAAALPRPAVAEVEPLPVEAPVEVVAASEPDPMAVVKPGLLAAARAFRERFDGLREKKGARYEVLARIAPKETRALIEAEYATQGIAIALDLATKIKQPAAMIWCINLFGFWGQIACTDKPAIRAAMVALDPAEVAGATMLPPIEIDLLRTSNGYLGPIFEGIMRNTSNGALGEVDIKIQIRSASGVLLESASDFRAEGLGPRERWKFKATAFDGKLSAGYTFEIEMSAQPHD